ncbi:MAG: sensor histidine kinase [Candidatus Binatia bacterium]
MHAATPWQAVDERSDRLPGPSVRAIYTAKAAAIATILLLMWLIKLFVFRDVPAVRYSIIITPGLLATLAVVAWRGEALVWLLAASFAADITAVTVGIHFGGGVDNISGPVLYALVIVLVGLVLSEGAAYVAAAGSSILYGLLVWAEQCRLLAHQVPYSKPADDAAATVILVSVYLFLAAWVVSYAARQIRAIYQRAERMRSEAVSALSHDLKSPLSIIHGYAEMADAATPTDRADYLRRIQHAAQQALDLVHNVLDATAIEERSIVPKVEPVRLNDLVQQVFDLYQLAAEGKEIQLTAARASDLPVLDADPQLLSRAIGNLVSNAIKYTDRGGTVRIATAWQERDVTVTVEDNGYGIPAEDLTRIFQKYSRSGSRRVEGTGLGLYIVRCIAAAHGGSVRVTSEVGKGSTFSLALPIHPRGC